MRLPDSVLFEEVFVNAFDHICLLILHADIVANHQPAKSRTVDQDDSSGHPVRVRDGLRRESARGDEDAPIRLGTVQRSHELLDLWPPDTPAPTVSLGLNVNAIQPQRILTDHSVQAFIS